MCFQQKRGLLERLENDEVVIGDGGFVFALEKRGYVKAGPWTPEAVLETPEAGNFEKIFEILRPYPRLSLRCVVVSKVHVERSVCF